jgi:nicotinamide-nucleotide amidase
VIVLSLNVEILCVGDELLSGLVLNTNSRSFSRRITEIGGDVKRSTVIGDEICEISSAVRESLAREIDWLVISGG